MVLPLSHWRDQQLITTRCTNTDAVVEFVIVPFIIEDKTDPAINNATNHTSSDEMEEDGDAEEADQALTHRDVEAGAGLFEPLGRRLGLEEQVQSGTGDHRHPRGHRHPGVPGLHDPCEGV